MEKLQVQNDIWLLKKLQRKILLLKEMNAST